MQVRQWQTHSRHHPSPSAVIEKYARNTRFCLICNYVSKIIPALQSRCTRFRFAPLNKDAIVGRLQYIVDKEGLTSRCVRVRGAAVRSLVGHRGAPPPSIHPREGARPPLPSSPPPPPHPSIRLTPEGQRAVLQLGAGDMRKVLNVLQAAAASFDVIDEEAIYSVTGNPRPEAIRGALAVLLKGTYDEGYKRAWRMAVKGVWQGVAAQCCCPLP